MIELDATSDSLQSSAGIGDV